jgi:hypothetical protein
LRLNLFTARSRCLNCEFAPNNHIPQPVVSDKVGELQIRLLMEMAKIWWKNIPNVIAPDKQQ